MARTHIIGYNPLDELLKLGYKKESLPEFVGGTSKGRDMQEFIDEAIARRQKVLSGEKTFRAELADRAFRTSVSAYFWVLLGSLLTLWLILRFAFAESVELLLRKIRRKQPTFEHNPDYYNVRER